jgi:hypothetical protein
MAKDNLDKYCKIDEKVAQKLLLKPIDELGGITCLQLAINGKLRIFVSHDTIQNYLSEVWNGKLRENQSILKVTFNKFQKLTGKE